MFAVFLDASKAFDKVNHDLLFKTLILRNLPLYCIRLLRYWYKTQMMKVRWNNYFSDSFLVSNGVRQGGILSPYLFSLYIDDLTSNLNTIKSACYVGNYCLNHIIFADDICLFSPSLVGLQDLLNACYNYAQSHKMLFNCNKSFGMLFAPKNFNLSSSPKLLMDNSEISFVQSVKYLGLHISSDLTDDIDIQRQVKSLHCSANKLKQQFSKCSLEVKNYLFKHFCMPFYGSHLWCNYRKYNFSRLRVAYNDSYRILHHIPRCVSASNHQVQSNIDTLDALIRKYIFSFTNRCINSQNIFIMSLMSSDLWYKSFYYQYFVRTLF